MQQQQQQQQRRKEEQGSGFYRRPLPDTCVDFGSAEGRALFAEALAQGRMDCYFPLAAQFHTQRFCGLGTLAMVLNALAIDPQRIWKGPWRWFSEELLDCCSPLEVIKSNGITIAEFVCLARCNGATVRPTYAKESDVNAFRELVNEYAMRDDRFIVVSYDRRGLNQTGSGHFSPIGGYHAQKDMVLILDVARFKYPPHWVPLPTLFAAMQTIDPTSQRSRGFICLTAAPQRQHIFSRMRAGAGKWIELVDRLCHQLPALFSDVPGDVELEQFVTETITFITSTPAAETSTCAISSFFSTYGEDLNDRMTIEHRRMIEELFTEIHATLIYRSIQRTMSSIMIVAGNLPPSSSSSSPTVPIQQGIPCCRKMEVNETEESSPGAPLAVIRTELAVVILFFLLRLLADQQHSACEDRDGEENEASGGRVRFGRSVEEAMGQLQQLPRLAAEVEYLWTSFRNIARYCACRVEQRKHCKG